MFNLFRSAPSSRRYITPGGKVWRLYQDMSEQPHLLIAGATGSGKSVVINGILDAILHRSPNAAQLILIDPKRVELVQYKDLPHCIYYATEPEERVSALERALAITEKRYKDMASKRLRKFDGSDVYVIIDELADMMTTQKKAVAPLLQRLCQIGRAAGVHCIAATQCPLSCVIPTPIKVNFDSRVGLRTRCAQDSRNILGATGCELLPRYGKGYYMTPEGMTLYDIPMVSDEELNALCEYWTPKRCYVA